MARRARAGHPQSGIIAALAFLVYKITIVSSTYDRASFDSMMNSSGECFARGFPYAGAIIPGGDALETSDGARRDGNL